LIDCGNVSLRPQAGAVRKHFFESAPSIHSVCAQLGNINTFYAG